MIVICSHTLKTVCMAVLCQEKTAALAAVLFFGYSSGVT